jgi:hypothetical protein
MYKHDTIIFNDERAGYTFSRRLWVLRQQSIAGALYEYEECGMWDHGWWTGSAGLGHLMWDYGAGMGGGWEGFYSWRSR